MPILGLKESTHKIKDDIFIFVVGKFDRCFGDGDVRSQPTRPIAKLLTDPVPPKVHGPIHGTHSSSRQITAFPVDEVIAIGVKLEFPGCSSPKDKS
ncbi:hypothetical protein GCM10007385_32650 [Tateyamaria omphalii]|nr:hypothetical protein GCM10007385_32650 [Tateyamaria omphalii]